MLWISQPASAAGRFTVPLPATSEYASLASPPCITAWARATRRRSASCARKKGSGANRRPASGRARRSRPPASVSWYSAESAPRGCPAAAATASAKAAITDSASAVEPG